MATIQIDAAASVPLRESERPRPKKRSRSCWQWWSILPLTYKFFIILIVLAVLLVGFLFIEDLFKNSPVSKTSNSKAHTENNSDRRFVPNPGWEYNHPKSYSKLHLFKNGAVCSDTKVCSEIGRKILDDGGNVVDSALATLFCNGITTMQSNGIGGGFVMTLFMGGKAYSLNAKDVAPINLKNDTFKTAEDYYHGPLSINTPGEIKGYWELHKRFGSIKWKDLIQPAIDVCEGGIEMTEHMYDGISIRALNLSEPYFRKMFVNSTTNETYGIGTRIYPAQQLCDTYKIIAENGGEDYYTGHLADLIVEDLQDMGSVITKQDLQEYKTVWSESIPVKLNDHTMYIPPAPTGGGIVALILNILKGYGFSPDSIATQENKILTYHRILESFKFAFGQRSKIGDPAFVQVEELYNNLTSAEYGETLRQKINDSQTYNDPLHYGAEYDTSVDSGTAHMSIIAPNGDAISVTTSVNIYFGSGRPGKRTGIMFNTGANDFSIRQFQNQFGLSASPANFLQPKKRALTSMSPIIVTDKNNEVQLVLGASGGTKIITAVSLTIIDTLWFQQDVKEAIDSPRIHHQLEPMLVDYEFGIPQPVIDGLERRGHKTKRQSLKGAMVCAIFKNETGIYGNADFRKKGDVVGL